MRLAAGILLCFLTFVAVGQEQDDAQATADVRTLETSPDGVEASSHQTIGPAASSESNVDKMDRIDIIGSRVAEHAGREWTDIEVYLTVGILILTALLAAGVIFLASTAQKAWSPQSILRVLGVVLIVPLAVLLVAAGYSEKQIAAVMGLLGVIAGYLLGNGEKSRGDI